MADTNSKLKPAAPRKSATQQRALFDDPGHRPTFKRDLSPACGHPDRKVASRLMCQPCYKRWLATTAADTRPAITHPGRGRYAAASVCHPDLPGRAHGMCQPCYQKAYRQKNLAKLKAKSQEKRIQREYGLTLDQVTAMRDAQGGKCAICRQPPSKGNRMHIDHCHATGVVRELLCRSCNMYLGTIEARAAQIPAFLQYLERHRATEGETA